MGLVEVVMWFTGLPAYRQHVLTVTDHAPHLLYNQTVNSLPSGSMC